MPIKDCELRCESESSGSWTRSRMETICPSGAAFNPKKHTSCLPAVWDHLQLWLGHLSIHRLLAQTRKAPGGRSRTSLLTHSAGERTVCLLSSLVCCLSPHKHTQTHTAETIYQRQPHKRTRSCPCARPARRLLLLYGNCVIKYSGGALSGAPPVVLLNSPFCQNRCRGAGSAAVHVSIFNPSPLRCLWCLAPLALASPHECVNDGGARQPGNLLESK